jgi:hypothetical protein
VVALRRTGREGTAADPRRTGGVTARCYIAGAATGGMPWQLLKLE